MNVIHTCIRYTHVCHTHMYRIHTWMWYTHVLDAHMNVIHTCIGDTHECDTRMYLIHTCIWYTHVLDTHMNVIHTYTHVLDYTWMWYTHECDTHMHLIHTCIWYTWMWYTHANYTHAFDTHMYVIHTCIWYTHECADAVLLGENTDSDEYLRIRAAYCSPITGSSNTCTQQIYVCMYVCIYKVTVFDSSNACVLLGENTDSDEYLRIRAAYCSPITDSSNTFTQQIYVCMYACMYLWSNYRYIFTMYCTSMCRE